MNKIKNFYNEVKQETLKVTWQPSLKLQQLQ